MSHRLVLVASLAFAGLVGCSLNPQPLPPDNPGDAGGTNFVPGPPTENDAGTPQGRNDGGATDAGAQALDASPMPPPVLDGGEDGASTDGGTDAPADAPPTDAPPDDGGTTD
jgi:hypothetical protein